LSWTVVSTPNPAARARLFCVPYAGGGASIFKTWGKRLPEIEVLAIQLPGRESRLRERPIDVMDELVEQLAAAVAPELDRPFAVFGHSMGALVGFELTRLLRRLGWPLPMCLFVSASRPPQAPPGDRLYDLDGDELVQALRELNGTPPDVLELPELLELRLPVVRADFQVVDEYRYREEPPLECPIGAFAGMRDEDASPDVMRGWSVQTSASFSQRTLAGDHFFIVDEPAAMIGDIRAQMLRAAAQTA
jgi:medium-chain acyl-[acyl-carrier-protein] hydrolase